MTMTHELPAWVTDELKKLSVERELPKWPVLTVVGENVSPELGREICVRTTRPSRIECWLDGDEEWAETLAGIYGFRSPGESGWMRIEEQDRIEAELGILPLECLGNDRVTATRFELPSGWCDWDGTIGTAGTHFDSGWPSLADLNGELQLITEVWPELNMTVQLSTYKDADRYGDVHPFLTWDVAHGSAVLRRTPGEAIRKVMMPQASQPYISIEAGRGTDAETLRQAVAEAKERVNG